ncbi:hypothetical protein FRC07_012430 [Ceratobasidium sp. 392]|nr:hypothetical protein FRC07_012430 [Ceratobasidium sp. 392]
MDRSLHEWMQFMPARCERWGKLRISDENDCIQRACARNPLSTQGNRDNSFVRFEFDKDRNYHRQREEIDMYKQVGYGRLDFILALSLPPNPDFDIHEP